LFFAVSFLYMYGNNNVQDYISLVSNQKYSQPRQNLRTLFSSESSKAEDGRGNIKGFNLKERIMTDKRIKRFLI
jgi:hypothetical protein